jgi:hypothetical protein
MIDVLSKVDGGQLIAIIAVGGGMLIGIISVLAGVWQKIHESDNLTKLKQDMLDRGMSAEEIKMVLEAGQNTKPTRTTASS